MKKYEEFGPVVREEFSADNAVVWLFDPDDIKVMYEADGKMPMRRSHLGELVVPKLSLFPNATNKLRSMKLGISCVPLRPADSLPLEYGFTIYCQTEGRM